jgi:hypothetical protein
MRQEAAVHGALLAVVHPDDTPHGYNLTFAFPMLMFIIIAGALYLRFRAAHSVPGHVPLMSSRWAGLDKAGGTGTVNSGEATAGAPAPSGTAPEETSRSASGTQTGQARPADESTEEG